MPEYVLKVLFRFSDRDDVEARDTMNMLLGDVGCHDEATEFTLRSLGTRHGGKSGRVVSSGVLNEKDDDGG